MPKFSKWGHDEVMCQLCGRRVDTGKENVAWRPDLTGMESAGNVCEKCVAKASLKVFQVDWDGPCWICVVEVHPTEDLVTISRANQEGKPFTHNLELNQMTITMRDFIQMILE